MKKVIKNNKYVLVSGFTILGYGTSVKEILQLIGTSFSYAYSFKHKNLTGDGSWSFNYKNYIYTIYTTDEFQKLPEVDMMVRKRMKDLLEKRKQMKQQ
jgi:hypothetical protein